VTETNGDAPPAASAAVAGAAAGAPVSVRRRVAIGAALMVAMRFAFRGIGLVSTLILARLLTPEDFGLVGFETIAYSVLDQLSDLSSSVALIRMKNPERRHYDTAWTLGVFRGLLSGLLFRAGGPVPRRVHP
jgi:PST family polysaccharide transporter